MATWDYALDSDDDTAEGNEEGFTGSKTALLVLIDSTPGMFEKMENGEVPFSTALKCCHSIWRSKIISNDKNVVSLLFVGTKKSTFPSFENIYQLQELSPVKVEMIEKLIAMKDKDDYDGFEENIGKSEDYNLQDVFWVSKMIIDEGKANKYHKKMMYFTRNDSPHDGKPNMQADVVKKFRDIGKVSMTVVAFGSDFDKEKFYSKIVEDETDIINASSAENLESLMRVVRVQERGRRAIRNTTLELAPGVKLAVGLYSFARPAKPPRSEHVHVRTNEPVTRTVNTFRAETGMPVLKSEERKMVTVQGEQAIFTPAEIKEIKMKQNPETGLSLICFIGMNDFKHFSWYRSPGYFIYPDDERINGSKNLFAAFLKRCAALEKIAIVKMVMSRGMSMKLACLIPSIDDPVFPQGFHVFPIPFADEMRHYDFENNSDPSPELESLMEKVVKKVTNKRFDVRDVYNPSLQHQWRKLERLALDMSEEDQEEFQDYTEPNETLMIQRLENLPDLIQSEVGGFVQQKSTASVTGSVVKMESEVKNKTVEKLTVPVLKEFLKSKKIDVNNARKADLVKMVYDYYYQK